MNDLSNCIRFLTVDSVLKANSGHVGMCLGLSDVMTVLFTEFLKHDPKNPQWVNRDRVVLSNGHGSMLLYSALYLSGYDWDIETLKRFRQKGSEAAGHPEYDLKKGIEVTTGPLGQGLANALGMAIAKERLQSMYPEKIDYTTYCFVGDGCLMEGISHEVGALAPKLVSSGLVVIWDDNGVSIDGKITPWFEQDVLKRFKSYGFHVIENIDGHDFSQIRAALKQAKQVEKPCFIQMKTTIGKGVLEIEGEALAHGQPLDQSMVDRMRSHLKWPHPPFEIPSKLKQQWESNSALADDWVIPQDTIDSEHIWQWYLNQGERKVATRKASSQVLIEIAKQGKNLIGGSADLSASNLTTLPDSGLMNEHCFENRYIAYGVREFGMFGIANGLALAGLTPYVGTFLTFMDYGKNALRMSGLMKQRVIYVLTHDSIGLGEDGPTHQPVEQLVSCRAIPNVRVWRPCNLAETVVAWLDAMSYQGPTVLALSRQPIEVSNEVSRSEIEKGGYVLKKVKGAKGVILATGSEVELALQVADQLDIPLEVMSIPCLSIWNGEINYDRESCFVIEAGSSLGWGEYAPRKNIFSVDAFGISAKYEDVYAHFGLQVDKIAKTIKDILYES